MRMIVLLFLFYCAIKICFSLQKSVSAIIQIAREAAAATYLEAQYYSWTVCISAELGLTQDRYILSGAPLKITSGGTRGTAKKHSAPTRSC